MALPEAQIVVKFAGGVETKQDRKGVLPGKLLVLENAVFDKEVSLVKRNGYEDLGAEVTGTAEPLPAALALGKRGGELLAFTEDTAYSRLAGAEKWIAAGEMRSVIADHYPAAKTGTNQTLADVAVNDGVALYAWEDSAGGVWYSLIDDETGRSLVAPTQASASGVMPRVAAVGGFLHLYYALVAPREIRALRFDPVSPTAAPFATVLLADLSGTLPLFDVDVDNEESELEKAVIAWNAPGDQIGVAYIHPTCVIGGTGLGLPTPVYITATVLTALSVCIDRSVASYADREVVVAFTATSEGGNSIAYQTFDYDLASVHDVRVPASEDAETISQITCCFLRDDNDAGDREAWIHYQLTAAAAQNTIAKALRTDTNASTMTVHETDTIRGCGLGSKAFLDENDVYVHLLRDSTLYRTYYTVRSGGLVVARFLSGLGNGLVAKAHLPSVVETADREYAFAGVYVVDVDTPSEDIFSESGIRRIDLDFESPEAFRSVELGNTSYIAGGLLHAYDGQRIVEAEFHYGIDDVAAPTEGSGGQVGVGSRNYVFVLENVLANGEIQRGPISKPVLVETTTSSRTYTFTLPTYRLTAMPNARIAAYRTIDGDPNTYGRVSSYDPTTVGDENGYIANSTSADTVTFVDAMHDDDVEEQEPLYSNGGIVENDPLGGARLVAGGKNRVFVVDAADPLRVYFSQERADGYAIETSPELSFPVDAYGGDITGITVMDASLVVFKDSAIYLVSGPGPLADPEKGGGWSEPQLVTSDVGCISPDSIGYTPLGVIFQSQKGIYLLGRDGSVSYVGASVEAYNAQTIVATTLIEDKTQIRLLTDSGKSLLYDYARDQWSTFTNHEGQDAIMIGGVYHYLRNGGEVWRETPDEYRDGNRQIRRVEETAWLSLAGHLQSWQYLNWLHVIGERKSAHTLQVRMAFDYEESWSAPIDIDPDEGRETAAYGEGVYGDGPYGGVSDTAYHFQIHVGQECKAVKFRFEDVEATGDYGASYELTELILVGGVLRSTFAVEEARTW